MKNKNIVLLIVIGILLIVSLIVGISYALWSQTHTQTTSNELLSGCFSTSLTEKNNINLTNQFPITDDEGLNSNPYTFTISNTCTVAANYQINLELLSSSTLDPSFVKISLDDKTANLLNTYNAIDSTITDATKAYKLTNGYLAPNSSATYNLRLWLTEEATINDSANKTINSKITINTSATKNVISDILINTAGGKDNISSKTTPNYSLASTTDDGLFIAPDDYGISYYYRGNVLNNNIIFANICWKAIRVNGNNTTRMIYNGTPSNGTCSAEGNDTMAAFSSYNDNNNDNAYVGFMFGNNLTASYINTHSNIISSTIKDSLDNWYQNNLLIYDSKISDSVFCNDRSLLTGTGLSSAFTLYGANNRIGNNYTPTYICSQKNDKFTKNDNQIGNTNLKYPIGLITMDEVEYAGSNMGMNKDYYLYTTNWYYTMTPNYFSDNPSIFIVGDSVYSISSNSVGGVRPVINLKYDNFVSAGIGTTSNPYQIS